MSEVGRVALLGAGVVGAGWAARFAVNGIDVLVHDPDPGAGARIDATLEDAARAYTRLTLAPPVPPGRIEVVASVEDAVEGAAFIQESVPEREEVKRPLLASASRAAPADAIIASSTSGLLPSRLQAGCARPDRIVVGHPFIPVYLLPLVEVVGGKATSAEAKERAAALYQAVGMHPLVLDMEIDAFVADRLLEAVWREALHLVNDGIATASQIADFVITVVTTGEEETRAGPKKRITCFLVDRGTPGFEIRPGYRAVSHRGYHNSILSFDDCRVPASQVLGEEGAGFELANTWLAATRLTVAAMCVGRARRCLDLCVDHAATRRQFGQPIGRFQGVSFKLADMVTEIDAADWLTLAAA